MSLEQARTVADAVLYEGYLLYPYRATSRKNQVRWQFGVLGPPGAATAGFGEEPSMEAQCLLRNGTQTSGAQSSGAGTPATPAGGRAPAVTVHLRFLQIQVRGLERLAPDDPTGYVAVEELAVGDQRLLSWDEAVEHEVTLSPYLLTDVHNGVTCPVEIGGGEETEPLTGADGSPVGRIVRRRWPLHAEVRLTATGVDDGLARLSVRVENIRAEPARDKDDAIRASLIGAHLLIEADGTEFVSLLEPPEDAGTAAAGCQQRRCWPVLAGAPGDTDVVLASPIILYDYPEVAAESAGALFDSTEIDEILTLRVMTLTDEEKAEARETDPRARAIIDRCDEMTPESLQQLHGILRDPHAGAAAVAAVNDTSCDVLPAGFPDVFSDGVPEVFTEVPPTGISELRNAEPPSFETGDVPWWDPAADASVQPDVDAVMIAGVSVSKGSLVRVHPSRRADAQDLFFADQVARVTAVLSDVDGEVHVAVVLVDDPAAELHDWYGRYLYFAPDELEPLPTDAAAH